jgi:hypothetical protein
VLAKLQAAGMQPSASADKRALLRRVTYDLTGLPPTPADSDAFLADSSSDALAKVIDRLLESRQYGVHWVRLRHNQVGIADRPGRDLSLFLFH